MLCALNTSIKRSYSTLLSSRLLSLKRHEPNPPDGVFFSAAISSADSKLVSIKSSSSAPMMPLRPAYTLAILSECLRAVSITPQADAFLTAVTPPVCV